MMLNNDFKDMLRALSGANVEFMVVGAYALGAHGYPRATGDIDIWVRPTPQNAKALMRALVAFGAPLTEVVEADFHHDDTIFQVGVIPNRVDIVTGLTGLDFDDVYRRSVPFDFDVAVVQIPSIDDMIANKRATGRTKDLADAEALEDLKSTD